MKKTIGFFTTTRAEFGILSPFISRVSADGAFSVKLFVGGTHLKEEFGETINEIVDSNFEITSTFDYLESVSDEPFNLTRSSGECMKLLASIFTDNRIDFICVLGDRYELIPIIQSALLFSIPIIHIGGGEMTEGVIDNKIRHMISMASDIHLTAAEPYSELLLSFGINSSNIKTVGSLAVETMKALKSIGKEQLFDSLGLDSTKQTVLMTYHPVTIKGAYSQLEQIANVFSALDTNEYQIVVTSPNLEAERDIIISYIEEKMKINNNIHLFDSLGMNRYLSLIPHCLFVIGNSSSGLFEVPFFRVPTINIGNRQKGRYLHSSVIQADNSVSSISKAIEIAKSPEFRNRLADMRYLFGDGKAAEISLNFLKEKIL